MGGFKDKRLPDRLKEVKMRLKNIPAAKPAIENSDYCIKTPKDIKGHWKESVSGGKPIFLEIGMGKGQFIMSLAARNPDIFYLGMELHASVLYRGLQKLEADPLDNLLLLNHPAEELCEMFEPGEINGIYLNFSDPWPKDRHAKRRLTSPAFLDRYSNLLKKGGRIEFKTDNRGLFDYSVETITSHPDFDINVKTYDLHADPVLSLGNIMTEYEERFSSKGNPICKLVAEKNS